MAQSKKNTNNMNINSDKEVYKRDNMNINSDEEVSKRESINSVTPLFGPLRRSSNIVNSSKKKNTNIKKSVSMPILRLTSPEKKISNVNKTIPPELTTPIPSKRSYSRTKSNVSNISNTTNSTGLATSFISSKNAFSTTPSKHYNSSTRRNSRNSRSSNSNSIPENLEKLHLGINSSSNSTSIPLHIRLSKLNKDICKKYYSDNKVQITDTELHTIEQYKNFYTKDNSSTNSTMTDRLRKLNKSISDKHYAEDKNQQNSQIGNVQEYRREYTKKQTGGKTVKNKSNKKDINKQSGGDETEINSYKLIAEKHNRVIYKIGIRSKIDNTVKYMFIKIYKYNIASVEANYSDTAKIINSITFHDTNTKNIVSAIYEGLFYKYFNHLTHDTANVANVNLVKTIKTLGFGFILDEPLEIMDPDIPNAYHNLNIFEEFKTILQFNNRNVYTYLITECDDDNITFSQYAKGTSINKMNNALTRAKEIINIAFYYFGFVHGDLHLENIIINRKTEEIYLFDFDMSEIGGIKYNNTNLVKFSSDIEDIFSFVLPFMFYILQFEVYCFELFYYKNGKLSQQLIDIHKNLKWLYMLHAYDQFRLTVERTPLHTDYSNKTLDYYCNTINIPFNSGDPNINYLCSIYRISGSERFTNLESLISYFTNIYNDNQTQNGYFFRLFVYSIIHDVFRKRSTPTTSYFKYIIKNVPRINSTRMNSTRMNTLTAAAAAAASKNSNSNSNSKSKNSSSKNSSSTTVSKKSKTSMKSITNSLRKRLSYSSKNSKTQRSRPTNSPSTSFIFRKPTKKNKKNTNNSNNS